MPLRQIVFDTETTGLDAKEHRVVEIGAVELVDYVQTGRTFHVYLNPQRDMPAEAEKIHGLSSAFLADKPLFGEIVKDFLAFIELDDMVAHNGPFDMGMLNEELARLGLEPLENKLIDTVRIARQRYPGSKNSLDALMDRFEIDRSGREFHGALLDSQLLSQVYICLLDRHTLIHSEMAPVQQAATKVFVDASFMPDTARHRGFERRLVIAPSADEASAHEGFVGAMKDSIWSKLAAA